MTAQEFLEAFATQVGVPAPTAEELDTLLEVASVAAHGSERLAAPLACWLGRASGRPTAEPLAVTKRVVTGSEAG